MTIPLALAIPNNPKIVELLLKAGANPDAIKKAVADEPVIISAIYYNDPVIVKTLLDYNANPNKRWNRGTTPLIYAIYSDKNPAIVDILLQYHADPNLSDEHGTTPLAEAFKKENAYIIKQLLRAGADPKSIDIESLNEKLSTSEGSKKALYQSIFDMLDMYSAEKKVKMF